MTIKQAISILQHLLEKNGDIEVLTDCEFCGKTTKPNTIVIGPPVITIKNERK